MNQSDGLRQQVSAYCVRLAQNPLLVQAAGGNVSWKTGAQLWIKASGTWLAEAEQKDIFVPVDLQQLSNALEQGNFAVSPVALRGYTLRPSIETLLHALMPQKIVLHLHPVDVVSWLVRQDAEDAIKARLPKGMQWALVDYFKPGPELARAVQDKTSDRPQVDLVFLKNHGVLFGASSLEQLDVLLQQVMTAFNVPPREIGALQPSIPMVQAIDPNRYTMCSNEAVHCLATDPSLYAQLEDRWAICPDHVVFLGAVAGCVDDINTIATLHFESDPPPFLFVRGLGVLQSDKVSAAQQAQLAFYRDLLVRTDPVVKLAVLTQSDIVGLLNWDAEKYRIALNQTKSGA